MKATILLAALFELVIPVAVWADNNAPIKTLADAETLISGFKYQTGHVDLYGGLAAIEIPDGALRPIDPQVILGVLC